MPDTFSVQRRVEFRDTDAAGIVHFTAFFAYMEEAEHALLRACDTSVVVEEDGHTISWPRVSAHCDFSGAAHFEEVLTIEVCVERLGEKSATYGFRFISRDTEIAVGRITSVCCQFEPNQPPQSIAIPSALANRLKAYQRS